MTKELKLKIAGIGISIKWDSSRIVDWPHSSYQDFVLDDNANVNLRIHCGHLPEFSFNEMLFDGKEEGNWKLYQSNSGFVIETFDTLTHKKNKVCFLESDFQSGDVYIDAQSERSRRPKIRGSFFSLPSLMQPLGEILLVNLLAKDQGIMVHGLGISDNENGMAFLGGTGTGKSTLAEFYKREEGVNIFCDEHIVVKKEKGVFRIYGTPWPGMAAATSSKNVPLKKIFFIEHAPKNKILGRGTMSDLLPLLFLPFWDKEKMGLILEFCEELLKKIDCKKLGFIKDRSVVEFARRR